MELITAIKHARRVYLVGNGGSAANAMHIANDLLSCNIRAHALTADMATITAIANDFGYEQIFSRQLIALGERGDLLIALSGSGNSPNILQALKIAHDIGMTTFAIVGLFGTPAARRFADYTIAYGINMQEAENYQLKLGHDIYRILRGLQ